jgi:hypothetical protein
MYRSLTAPVVAIALLLGGSAGARAALIPPGQLRYEYNFTPDAPAVHADAPGTGSVSLSNENPNWATGAKNTIVTTNLNTASVATVDHPDVISHGDYGISVKLSVADQIGHGPPISGTLHFAGRLSGSFYDEGSAVENTFTDAGPKTLFLGGYKFQVKLYQFTSPGPANQPVLKGSISAQIMVSLDDRNPNPNPQETPEPASFLLCGLGAALGGFAWWRRRKPAEA